MPPPCPAAAASGQRPRFEVGDIARAHADEVAHLYSRGSPERRVLSAWMRCRTAALGGHLDVCTRCGHERPSYNSCRNRHCPKCQALAQHRWLEARRQRLLPVHHFHVVFTLPSELRALVYHNRRRMCDALFRAAADTLLELGREPRWLGAELGLTAVLHTWSRDLSWHPHLHCVVTGGGLDAEGRWRATREGFLFPVRVLGRLFRGKYLDAIRRLDARGQLRGAGDLAARLDALYNKDWLVYAKRPFGDTDAVFAYLGRYTHRIGLSNRRILAVDERGVTFRTRHQKQVTLPAPLFLRRLLRHVLPDRFVRIRHYGLLSSRHVHGRLALARALLSKTLPGATEHCVVEGDTDDDDRDEEHIVALVRRLTGIDLRRCPRCHERTMALYAAPLPNQRAPP